MILSYLVGSIPGSIWIGKVLYNKDIREFGSGNAGATNTFRVLGWKAGVLATAVDLGKGLIAAGLFASIRIDTVPDGLGFWEVDSVLRLIAGVAAVAGHIYPIWADFQGGKGVNTTAGVLFALTPYTMLLTLGVFALVLFISRYVSLASMSAAVIFPSAIAFQKYVMNADTLDASIFFFSLLLAASIFYAHRTNIKRLIDGKEHRIRTFRPARGMQGRGEI